MNTTAKSNSKRLCQFLQLLLVFDLSVVSGCRQWQNVNLTFTNSYRKKASGREGEGEWGREQIWKYWGGQEVDPPKWQTITNATAQARILSPHLQCVVALSHWCSCERGVLRYCVWMYVIPYRWELGGT
jgi:hypothetical protein